MTDNAEMSLNIEEKNNGDFAVVKLAGSVDIFSFKELQDQIEGWLEKKDRPRLLADLAGVTYMGSSGWSSLMRVAALLERKRGRLVTFGASEKIYRTLRLLISDNRVLLSAPDYEAALKLLDSPQP